MEVGDWELGTGDWAYQIDIPLAKIVEQVGGHVNLVGKRLEVMRIRD